MTRPLTKAQLSLMAAQIDGQRQQDAFIQFLMRNMALGAGVGIGIASLILLKDTFALASSVASPIRSPQHSASSSAVS